jgi:hypothetical protein
MLPVFCGKPGGGILRGGDGDPPGVVWGLHSVAGVVSEPVTSLVIGHFESECHADAHQRLLVASELHPESNARATWLSWGRDMKRG